MKVWRAVADRHPFLRTSDCIGSLQRHPPLSRACTHARSDRNFRSRVAFTICRICSARRSAASLAALNHRDQSRGCRCGRIARRFHQKKSAQPVSFESTECPGSTSKHHDASVSLGDDLVLRRFLVMSRNQKMTVIDAE
jgi:hypothetical protein